MSDLAPELRIDLHPPVEWNGGKYDLIELHEPTVQHVIKALAESNGSANGNHKMLMSLIASVTGHPRQVIEQVPISKFNQAGEYLLRFLGDSLGTTES